MKRTASLHTAFALACAAAIVAGAAAHALGRPGEARLLWMAVVVAAMAVLAVAIVRDLLRRRAGVDVVALLAMGGALALGQSLAGAVIALMYATGTALEEHARRRAVREISSLLERVPKRAQRYERDAVTDVAIDDVRAGDRLLIRAGEPVPVDGVVSSETALVDESALTGESLPVRRRRGDPVASGCINAGDAFDVDAAAAAAQSTYANVVRAVEHAQASRAPLVRLADRFAFVFVPATLAFAGATWALSGDPLRALAVLVVATPCPLLLAAPVAILAGVSRAARRGILVKDGAALETLARVRVALLDKTGTITRGRARVASVETCSSYSANELLGLAAAADQASHHVLARAVVEAARHRGLALSVPSSVREEPGAGVRALVDGHEVRVGSLGWARDGESCRSAPENAEAASHAGDAAKIDAWARHVHRRAEADGATVAFVAVGGVLSGALVLADRLRAETPRALRKLRRAGIRRIVLLSGDRHSTAESIALALGFDDVLAERTALDKVDAVRAERSVATVMMVGDGVNDAPALAAADVGVAMGARGSAVASQAASVVLLADDLERLAEAVALAVATRAIAVQSMAAGMALSGVAMIAASAGLLAPLAGAVVQELIDVAVIVNALRAVRAGRQRRMTRGVPPEMAARLSADHEALAPVLERIVRLADGIDRMRPADARAALRDLDALLKTRLLPHEQADETTVYPYLEREMGGFDPLAAMSRTHREIHHLARRLAGAVEELEDAGAGEHAAGDWVRDVRRTLYALHAVLALHFEQEEELYAGIAIAEAGAATQGASSQRAG